METIEYLKKYNLDESVFKKEIQPDEKGNSLSIIRNKITNNEEDSKYDYIILCNGNRVIDISKDLKHPYGQRNYVRRILDYFKKKNKNAIVEHILLDKDAPLDLESKIIAEHIDSLASNECTNSIHLIGHSKGATILFNMPKYFNNEKSNKISSMYLTAAPYEGCLIATKNIFLEEVRQVIDYQLPKPINDITYEYLKKYYNSISSNSHMDNDIARIGYQSDKYDPEFIKEMFNRDNINAIEKIKYIHNFITGIDDRSLMNSIKRRDFTSIGMCLLDKYFIEGTSDGFVEQKSQLEVNNHIEIPNTIIKSATHYFLAHDDELEIVLNEINNQIDIEKEKRSYVKTIKYK